MVERRQDTPSIRSPDKETWREHQIVAMLYRNARGAMAGSMVNIAIVAYVLYSIFPGIGLIAWFIVGQGLNLIRLLVHSLYVKDIRRFQIRTWLYFHRFLTFLSGSLYGVLAIFFFSSSEPLYQALVIFLVGGMGAAAVGTHGVDMLTYRLFLYAGLLPLITRSLYEGTEVHNTLAIMLALMAAIMLRSAKQTREIILENIDMSHSLHYRATHDGLVGLLNRDEFKNIFETEYAKVPAPGVTTAMMFIDLDDFKRLNDTLGHAAGDQALIKIGDIIRHAIRKTDIAGRFGGDEFMILLRAENLEDIQGIGQKILDKLADFQSHMPESAGKVGASIGIGYSQKPVQDFDTILKAADKACYQAKNTGKGKICLLSTDTQ